MFVQLLCKLCREFVSNGSEWLQWTWHKGLCRAEPRRAASRLVEFSKSNPKQSWTPRVRDRVNINIKLQSNSTMLDCCEWWWICNAFDPLSGAMWIEWTHDSNVCQVSKWFDLFWVFWWQAAKNFLNSVKWYNLCNCSAQTTAYDLAKIEMRLPQKRIRAKILIRRNCFRVVLLLYFFYFCLVLLLMLLLLLHTFAKVHRIVKRIICAVKLLCNCFAVRLTVFTATTKSWLIKLR